MTEESTLSGVKIFRIVLLTPYILEENPKIEQNIISTSQLCTILCYIKSQKVHRSLWFVGIYINIFLVLIV